MAFNSEEDLKNWLRENLIIVVEPASPMEPSNDVYVGLKFVGDSFEFSYETVHIPWEV